MKIALPFPNCPKCNKNSNFSFHSTCNGRLRIDTSTNNVHCDSCSNSWNIWDSTYICNCGHTFSASEIKTTLSEVIAACLVAAEELHSLELSRQVRLKSSKSSMRTFFESFFSQLGYSFGISIGSLIEAVLSRFFK